MIAILDKIDVAISRGRRVYVHSSDGRGRVGTVVGCSLVRHGMTGEEALKRIRILQGVTPTGHPPPPETEAIGNHRRNNGGLSELVQRIRFSIDRENFENPISLLTY